MNYTVVIGGSLNGSFVLEKENIIRFSLRSKANEATLVCKHCGPFNWFLSKIDLENQNSIWTKGVKDIHYSNSSWLLVVDTNYIPVNVVIE